MASAAPIRRSFFQLALALTIAATIAVPVAAAGDTDIDGTYSLALTVTKDCDHPDADGTGVLHFKQGGTFHLNAKVAQNGSTVSFTFADQATGGSIDADLNFDVPVDPDHWIGHFTSLSDGGVTMSGQVVGDCSGATGPYMNITGQRTSGGAPSATPTPLGKLQELLGYQAGGRAYGDYCAVDDPPPTCEASKHQGGEWFSAMLGDRDALHPAPSPDLAAPLNHLMLIVEEAAQLGTLTFTEKLPDGSCTPPRPVYPLLNFMLPAFARLFVQGITYAGKGQLEGVTTARDLADALLAIALDASEHPQAGKVEAKCAA